MEFLEVLNLRKSSRIFTEDPLSLPQIMQVLFTTLNVPSAGALHPLTIYLLAYKIVDFTAGLYKFCQMRCTPILVNSEFEGVQAALFEAALNQDALKTPAVIVVTATYEKTMRRYGRRGIRYVHLEAGHVGQNISLMTANLGLGSVVVGAFKDSKVKEVLKIKEDPIYLIPVGVPR